MFQKRFNIYSAENVYRSIIPIDSSSGGLSAKSGTFGFTHLMDLSPSEVSFIANGSFMERLLFSMMRWERPLLDEIVDLLMEAMDDEMSGSYLERGSVRAVTRMLLIPSRLESNLVRRKFGVGSGCEPYEGLVVSHQDRLLSDVKLLHAAYTFIPRARAPPVCFS